MNILKTYLFNYLKYKILGDMNILISYYRNKGMSIGIDCKIYSGIATPESYLIRIGNNVTIATGAKFVTHDNSISKVCPEFTDLFGAIDIGDNCFIGAYSVILPGIKLGPNTIVASGSVVTKSFSGGVVIGGVPAKVICAIDDFRKKVVPFGVNVDGLSYEEKKEKILRSRLIQK